MAEFTTDWVSHNFAAWSRHLGHLKGKPAQGVEVGSWEGRSALWFLTHAVDHPESRLTCIDSWDEFADAETRFRTNVSPHSERLDIIKAHSFRALRSLPLHAFDFAYIDGAHEGMNVLEDGVLAWRLLKVGGVLIFDDYQYVNQRRTVQPRQAIDAFANIYPVELLHKSWQTIYRKTQENYYLKDAPDESKSGKS